MNKLKQHGKPNHQHSIMLNIYRKIMGNKNVKNKYLLKRISMMETIVVRKKLKNNSIFVINNVLNAIHIAISNTVMWECIHQIDIEIKINKYLQFKKEFTFKYKLKILKNQK